MLSSPEAEQKLCRASQEAFSRVALAGRRGCVELCRQSSVEFARIHRTSFIKKDLNFRPKNFTNRIFNLISVILCFIYFSLLIYNKLSKFLLVVVLDNNNNDDDDDDDDVVVVVRLHVVTVLCGLLLSGGGCLSNDKCNGVTL